MGQLIRENNPYTNLTTVYSYDKGGNITSAKEYAYTTAAELGAVKKTNTYTYEDIHWKDKLTSYNGEAITYDEIGNPLTYRDSLSFTWKNGRQLASLQNGQQCDKLYIQCRRSKNRKKRLKSRNFYSFRYTDTA